MATEVVKTIRSSGGDYTSLSGWESGRQAANADLTAADVIETAECYDDWAGGLSDELQISGFTVDETRYLRITVAEGHRHDGTPQSGFYIKKSSTGSSILLNWVNYTRLEWLDIEQTSTSADKYAFRNYNADTGIYHYACISKNNTSSTTLHAFEGRDGRTYVQCLAYGSQNGFQNFNGTIAKNCVAAGCGKGFGGAGGDGVATNCVAYNNTTNWATGWTFWGLGGYNATSSASDDAPGDNSVTGVDSDDFVDAANNDFHLAAGSALIGAGTNLYSDFTTDIDGDTWPSSGAWDIGFDYYASATPTLPTLSAPTLVAAGGNTYQPRVTATYS